MAGCLVEILIIRKASEDRTKQYAGSITPKDRLFADAQQFLRIPQEA